MRGFFVAIGLMVAWLLLWVLALAELSAQGAMSWPT